MDVEKLFQQNFSKAKQEDSAKNFLVNVQRVVINEKDPDAFTAIGVRVDTDQRVAITARKATSGQHLPSAGGVLRAEKVARQATTPKGIIVYGAKYFQAYQPDSLCLQAVIQPAKPRQGDKGMWSAQVHAYDVDVNDIMITADKVFTELDSQLVKMLTPWEADQSSITHDVKGDPVWGDGSEGKPGLAPFAVIRVLGRQVAVYGKGAIKMDRNGEVSYRLPNAQETLAAVQSNSNLQLLKNVIKGLPPTELGKLPIAIIPGLSISVGRDSLAGPERKYLAIPEAFDWRTPVPKAPDADPAAPATFNVQPGFRRADVHIKTSRTGRMMVVDAVPSVGSRLTQFIPETVNEREIRVSREAHKSEQATAALGQGAAAAPTDAPAQRQPQQSQATTAPATAQESKPVRQSAPAVVEPAKPNFDEFDNDFESPTVTDQVEQFDDAHLYAEDLAAIESMGMGMSHSPAQSDSDIDDLLNEANERQAQRSLNRPSMG